MSEAEAQTTRTAPGSTVQPDDFYGFQWLAKPTTNVDLLAVMLVMVIFNSIWNRRS